MNKTRIISRAEAVRLLKMPDCIEAMRETLREVSAGESIALQRTIINAENSNKLAGMASALPKLGIMGSKVCIFPGPATAKAGTHQGVVVIYSIESGELLAIVDAESITRTRTGATSAAATDILARPDASALALLGAGGQAASHLSGISCVRALSEVMVWDAIPGAAQAFCERWAAQYPGLRLRAFEQAKDAVAEADIVCTVSKAKEPILFGEWLRPGTHVNAVGACSPNAREIDTELLRRSRVYLDLTAPALRDAGDLVIPITAGEWSQSLVCGEVGEVLLGRIPGRTSVQEITLFETIGLSVQDLAAAWLIYQCALAENAGTEVEI